MINFPVITCQVSRITKWTIFMIGRSLCCKLYHKTLIWDITQSWLVTIVSGESYQSQLQGKAVRKELTHEDGTDRLSWNVRN
jgi:hypothetical protein